MKDSNLSIDTKVIYWLAGWLGGEGAFTIHPGQIRIEFSSTDLDIITRVNQCLKNPNKIYLRKRTRTLRKQDYYAKIYDNLAVQWMMTLYSLLGIRRRESCRKAIQVWKAKIDRGSGMCRTCNRPLTITTIKSGWNKGLRQTFCRTCKKIKAKVRINNA